MKNFIKLFFVIFVFTITTESFAQTFGIKAGLNLSYILLRYDKITYNPDIQMTPGFRVGATAEFSINKTFSFETSLLLSTIGYRTSYKDQYTEIKGKADFIYLDIPLNGKVSFAIKETKIYGVLGPYIAFGISGKIKGDLTVNGQTSSWSEEFKWGSDTDSDLLQRLDFGLTMGTGVEINSIQIGLFYSLGLANISSATLPGMKISNRVLGISLGYKF